MALSLSFKRTCEALSVAWRRRLGNRRAFDPLPASMLLQELEVRITTPNHYQGLLEAQREHLITVQDWSAMIIELSPITILHNPAHPPVRYESDMMHECAHILLKHLMIPFQHWGHPHHTKKKRFTAVAVFRFRNAACFGQCKRS